MARAESVKVLQGILYTIFISDMTIRWAQVHGTPHDTELIYMIYLVLKSRWFRQVLMDSVKGSRSLSFVNTCIIPIYHYSMRYVHFPIDIMKKVNMYKKR